MSMSGSWWSKSRSNGSLRASLLRSASLRRSAGLAFTRTNRGGAWKSGRRFGRSSVYRRWGRTKYRRRYRIGRNARSFRASRSRSRALRGSSGSRNPYLKLHITPQAYKLRPGSNAFIEYYRTGFKENNEQVFSDWTAWLSRTKMVKGLNAAASVLHGVPMTYSSLTDGDKSFCRQQYFNAQLAKLKQKMAAMVPGYKADIGRHNVAYRTVLKERLKNKYAELLDDDITQHADVDRLLGNTGKLFNAKLLKACEDVEREVAAAEARSKANAHTAAGDLRNPAPGFNPPPKRSAIFTTPGRAPVANPFAATAGAMDASEF